MLRRSYTRIASIVVLNGMFIVGTILQGAIPEIIHHPLPLAQSGEEFSHSLITSDEDGDFVRLVPTLIPSWLRLERCLADVTDHSIALGGIANAVDVVSKGGLMYILQTDAILKLDSDEQTVEVLTDFSSLDWGTGHSIAFGSDDFLYVSDLEKHQIIKVDPENGGTTLFAGIPGVIGVKDGSRQTSLFFGPSGLVSDSGGNLYVAEKYGNRLRKISPSGVVSTILNTGLSQPSEIDLDSEGCLWIVNSLANQLLKFGLAEGSIAQIVGSGQVGNDDGISEEASFTSPYGLAIDSSNFIWVSCANETIRKISPVGDVTTLEWDGSAFIDLRGLGTDPKGSVCLTDFESTSLYSLIFEYKLVGIPQVSHAGNSSLSFQLYDGTGNIGFYQATVSVNVPPLLTSTGFVTATEGKPFEYFVQASDANGDTPVISALELPGWLSFHNGNTLQGIPQEEDIGDHFARILLSDSRGGDQIEEIAIDVLIGNEPPSFVLPTSTDAEEDVAFSLNISATDTDLEDELVIASSELPEWMTLTSISRGLSRLDGTPLQKHLGDNTVILAVTDAKGASDTLTLTIQVANRNDAPVWITNASHNLTEDVLFELVLETVDEDIEDLHTIASDSLPNWLSLEDYGDGTALLSGTPLNEHVGNHSFEIIVSDFAGEQDQLLLDLTVNNVNDAPFFSTGSNHELTEDVTYNFSVEAIDLDVGDMLTITSINLPGWLTFIDNEDGTATLTGLPTNDHVGNYSFQIHVEDKAKVSTTVTHSLTVLNVNDPPFFTSATSHQLTEDEEYSFTIVAEDVDVGDSLILSSLNLPNWLTFTDNKDGTGTLIGLPTNANVGSHPFQIKVVDGNSSSVIANHTLVVTNVNDAPYFVSNLIHSTTEDSPFEIAIFAEDVDVGDSLVLSINNLPSWMTFQDIGNGSGLLSGTPLNEHVGSFTLDLSVSDGEGVEVSSDLFITVVNSNDAPVILSDLELSLVEDQEFHFSLYTSDVDVGDALSIAQVNLPNWVSFQDIGDGTGILSGTPLNEHVGSHVWSFVISDSADAEVEYSISVDISNTNDFVSWVSIPPSDLFQENSHYVYELVSYDPDIGDFHAISAPSLPKWLTLVDRGDGSALLHGTTPVSSVRSFQFEVIVKDEQGSEGVQEVQIEVPINGEHQPDILMPGTVSLNFDTGNFNVKFSILNKSEVTFYQDLTFTLRNLPEHFSVSNETEVDVNGNPIITLPLLKPSENREVTIQLASDLREPGDLTVAWDYQYEQASVPFTSLEKLTGFFYHSDWLGIINASEFPWIWHESLGWLFIQSNKPDKLWSYHANHQWLHIAEETFPYFLDMEPHGWLYLDSGSSTTSSRVFDYRTMMYIDW